MVTVVPRSNTYSDIGERLATGAVQGYQNRADEIAIQGALGKLGPNASARDVLNAITQTRTYSPQAKQQALSNYIGVEQFEELKRKAQKQESLQQQEITEKAEERKAKTLEAQEKLNRQKAEAIATIQNSNLPLDQKQAYIAAAERGEFSPASARAVTSRPSTEPSDYQIAENQAERFDKTIQTYQDKAIQSEQTIPLLETAIINNEAYGTGEKWFDTVIDTINSPLLNSLKSERGQKLEAIVPVSISGFSTKMSGVLTNNKINLISKKAVGLGKDKNANRMMLYLDYYDKKLDELRAKFSNDIIKENKYGLAPKDFDQQLRERLKPYQQMISKDIDRLLNDKLPISPISKTNIARAAQEELQPGEVAAIGPDGGLYALTEEELSSPEFKDYRRYEL